MTDLRDTRARRRLVADAMWGGFVYCPTSGRILEVLPHDDKVICTCRCSNPAVPTEAAERTSTHIVRFCRPATVDAFLDQEDADSRKLTDFSG